MKEKNLLEFGIKRENEERRDGGVCIVFNPKNKRYAVYKNPKGRKDVSYLFGGGFDKGENEKDGCLRELVEESGLVDFSYIEHIDKVITHYYNINKGISRMAQVTCFLVILNSEKKEEPKFEDHEHDFQLFWKTDQEILDSWKNNNHDKDYDHWIYFMKKSVERLKELGHI